jgi:hypothetical protein
MMLAALVLGSDCDIRITGSAKAFVIDFNSWCCCKLIVLPIADQRFKSPNLQISRSPDLQIYSGSPRRSLPDGHPYQPAAIEKEQQSSRQKKLPHGPMGKCSEDYASDDEEVDGRIDGKNRDP